MPLNHRQHTTVAVKATGLAILTLGEGLKFNCRNMAIDYFTPSGFIVL
jgi:hypothetical protein